MTTATESREPPAFDSPFTRDLPGDPLRTNERRQVHGACRSRVEPTPVAAPRLLAVSRELAATLGFPDAFIDSDGFARVMAGNALLPGMDPHAMCYGGHQFGNWAGQLGDGRAINLGACRDRDGARRVLQLKGAGPTPYSRTADGRAVLRSSVREYLCSEAMAHLGVPTTRALSLVTTGEEVVRDMFYDGNAAPEPGAVVCRVAPSFVRFGNFEIHAAREEPEIARALLDHVIHDHFPELLPASGEVDAETRVRWFREVARRTAHLVVEWMRVGFVHGVLNTDNMSVLGLTIDYGPYGWLDDFDPDWTPNTTDAGGRRYRFGQQPQIGMWNLSRLGNALVPLIDDTDGLQDALAGYAEDFRAGWQRMMAAKLGLDAFEDDPDGETDPDLEDPHLGDPHLGDPHLGDQGLCNELLAILVQVETDMTLFYRGLAEVPLSRAGDLDDADLLAPLAEAWYRPEAIDVDYRERLARWLRRWARRVARDGTGDGERRARMNRVNPKYVLRNYMAQLAIDAAEAGDSSLIHRLEAILRHPYDEQPEAAEWAAKRPDWARQRAGCSMLSCSS
jgi:uncharacterized protein YdiU (UPF0061 family)